MPDRSDKVERLNEQTDQYELPYVSKSRVKKWKENPEHFRLSYLEGIKEPETKAMKRGTIIHEAFEHYYEQCQRAGRHIEPEEPSALPHNHRQWADFIEPYMTNFFEWEHRRWQRAFEQPERYLPVGIEEEAWREDMLGHDTPPWMGIADAVLPAGTVPGSPYTNDDGVLIVDFKTGSVPREQYRDEGIHLELAYYELVFEDEYDVAGSAAYYPRENETLFSPEGDSMQREVLETAREMVTICGEYDGEQKFEAKEGPLCKWGMDSDQQSAYYGVCSQCTWAVPANNPETFEALVEQGYSKQEIANELGTSANAVGYWQHKMDL